MPLDVEASTRTHSLKLIAFIALVAMTLIGLASCGGGGSGSGGGNQVMIMPPSSQHPDLTVGTPSVDEASPETGASLTLSATVSNTGDGEAPSTTLRWYRSTDATIITSDTEVGTNAVGALAASGTSAQSIDLTAPSTAGAYYYGACVDAVSGESATTDNCSSSVQVTVSEPPVQTAPELSVGTPTVDDASPETGGSFALSATVSNTGDGEAPATTLRWYRSTDATIITSDTEVGTDAVGALAASGTSAQSIDLRAPSAAGTYYYGACVDAVSGESATTDNCSSSVQVTVSEPPVQTAPELSVGTPTVDDASPETGGSFALSATVSNTGDGESPATTLRFYRSTDATITISDTEMGTDAVGALAASGTSAQSIDLTAPSTAGTYYYGACVDAVADESDTSNNCSSSVQVTVVATQQQQQGVPDLVAASPSVSNAMPAAGTTFTLSATVSNTGDGEAPATTLRFYRSTDATIITSDTEVGTNAVGALAASGTSAQSIDLRAPSAAGVYYYGACVDAVSGESATKNNCSVSVHVTVLVTQQQQQGVPDLVAASPSVSNATPVAGTTFTLSATVRNAGDAASSSTTLRYYHSTDATISASDTALGTDAVGALAAAGTSAESISLTAPSIPGVYYYGACVDAVSGESATTNNCSASVQVTVVATQQQQLGVPDLVAASPSVNNSTPASGTSFTLSATVRNAGDAASSSTTLRYYRSTDVTITTSDTSVGTDAVGVLAALGSSSESVDLTAPSTAGTYYYGACVDAVADESDTTNNCSASVQVTVTEQLSPDLRISAIGGPSSAVGRDSFTLLATVSNTGDAESPATTLRYYRSTNATITTSDTQVGTDAVGALAPSGSSDQSIDLTAPSTVGTYYYGACVDTVTDESDTTNNCSASVKVEVERVLVPDLFLAASFVSVARPVTGGSFTLSMTLFNLGTGATAATTLRYYRSTDLTISTSDTQVGTEAVGALEPSGSSEHSIDLTAPSTTGTYYYGACVDTVPGELDTMRNCSLPARITVRLPQPDLAVSSPSVSDESPETGGEVTLSVTVKNEGELSAAATTLRYYSSVDSTISVSDTQIATDAVAELAASESVRESVRLSAPSTAGTYYLGACVDRPQGEINTLNNCSESVQVDVQ